MASAALLLYANKRSARELTPEGFKQHDRMVRTTR